MNRGRTVAIGAQDFGDIIQRNCFLVDKTNFIKEWWENEDDVTLITRPRRFGKTLNMSMLDYFFSTKHAGEEALFEGLSIWEEEKYRQMQGTYPVISLTFADIKQETFRSTYIKICSKLYNLYDEFDYILSGTQISEEKKNRFQRIKKILYSEHLDKRMEGREDAETAIQSLCMLLSEYYGKKVLIFMDEYDTPMQEAYIHGYWTEMVAFIRSMFNATFKTNPYMGRSIMTGITRVSKESIFSDLNNLTVVTTTSDEYATCFGFTEEEVFAAMDEMGLTDKEHVKKWYDGFIFGKCTDIYNPWSITNYLKRGKLDVYWANTSGNGLIGTLLRKGDTELKDDFQTLITGGTIRTPMDEQIIFDQLDQKQTAIWGLMVASGYLKVIEHEGMVDERGRHRHKPLYTLSITNLETEVMFENMVESWFDRSQTDYNDFVKAMFAGNLEEMNAYMNRVALDSFSYFDTGAGQEPSRNAPERFYHGFVLGLLVKTASRYEIRSNRESGFGRYDVMLLPRDKEDYGYILEFKVINHKKESSLEDTVASALQQIEEKQYETELLKHGVAKERIRKYGFAFEGKNVRIGSAESGGSLPS